MTSAAENPPTQAGDGLSLAPFRGLRATVDGAELARRLCPPYDVVSPADRARLLELDRDNVVQVILPAADDGGDPYQDAADRLHEWVAGGRFAADPQAALYVYEMASPAGGATRGLVGAVKLRAPEDGVILPHENTMAGPVADRLALMTATAADLEPIYLVYDGGGTASEFVRNADMQAPWADTTTPDGIRHRIWGLTGADDHAAVADDLRPRRALIADGHHRYATYRERQRRLTERHGAGPWDRGLALLVDSTHYGPQVHPIHRVIPDLALAVATERLRRVGAEVASVGDSGSGLKLLDDIAGFAVVLTDGSAAVVVSDPAGRLRAAAAGNSSAALAALDITVLHRAVIGPAWGLEDNEQTVRYAHSTQQAVTDATSRAGIAVLVRPTPVNAVASVAAAGERMPRKSTLFTPKPASGLVMRRFADQT